MSVIIETTVGDITVDLYIKERPRSCLNFLKLCKIKYYNYCIFHSVQRNFVAQTGDPTGTGRGGESIFRTFYGDQAKFFDAEKIPKIKHSKTGQLSMVNDGNGFHGSQFLLTLNEGLDSLDGVHTVFGEVAEGLDVLLKISEAFCDNTNRPFQDIRITHTVILDDPLDDPQGLVIPDRSPEPTKEQIEGCLRIGAEESLEDDEGLPPEEVLMKEEKKDASHRAQVLEIIGDLPDKDVKPPDNVLFVCKLNSITTDEDLEIIFSRFGTISSCEVIRDFKSGESLQYAFIEFEEAEMCEKAYHKMDNVLIDDRRIHVDFSQSVSKLQFPNVQKFSNNKEKDIERKNNQEKYNNEENKRESGRNCEDDRHSNKRRQKERRSPERSRDHNSHKRSRDSGAHKRSGDHDSHKKTREYDSNTRYNDLKSHRISHTHKNSHRDYRDSKKRSQNRESPKRHRDSSNHVKKSRDHESSKKERSPVNSPKRSRVEKSKKHRKQEKSSGSETDSSSSEEEVRCGKHKKRDVSQNRHSKRDRS